MSQRINKTKVWAGIGGVVVLLFAVHEYYRTGCVTPHFYEPVCGQQAWVILGVYGFLGAIGVYLIITGVKCKNNKGGNVEKQ